MNRLGDMIAVILLFLCMAFFFRPEETTKFFAGIVNTFNAETARTQP